MRKYIFDNIIYSLQRSGGISMMWSGLIDNLAADITSSGQFLEYGGASENIFRKSLNVDCRAITNIDRFPLILERYLSPDLDITEPVAFHSSYYRTLKNGFVKNVVTVHDFIYEKVYGKTSPARIVHHWQKGRAINSADKIVCVSRSTLSDLKTFYPDISDSRLEVVYNGISNDYYRKENRITDDYVLFVGSRVGYKNFAFVVDAVSLSSYRLVVAGESLTEKERKLVSDKLPSERFQHYKNPDMTVLNDLYNNAFCLVYPSSYEGFGLPVVEAQRAGCPVIALDVPSIREVSGQNALLMKDLSTAELLSKLEILVSDRNRIEITESGYENSLGFSMPKMTSEYEDIYRSLVG